MKEKDWEYEYWFACVRRMCAKTKKRIRDNVPSAKDIYYMEETELKRWTEKEEEAKELLESKKSWNLEKEYERLLKEGISFLPYFHSEVSEIIGMSSFRAICGISEGVWDFGAYG